jgi:hypothetical protein
MEVVEVWEEKTSSTGLLVSRMSQQTAVRRAKE